MRRLLRDGGSNGGSSLACGQARSVCDPTTLRNCECIVLQSVSNVSSAAINRLRDSTRTQALVNVTFAAISAALLCLYLSTYALAPRRMWRYPLNLAFWAYLCDLSVAVQFLVVASLALRYTSSNDPGDDWPITSNARCLCNFAPDHPGCACRGGILAFMLQFGLIGSTAITCCLSHNLFRSVADPFTRPSSRALSYQLYVWTATLALSIAYLIPQQGESDRWNGFGYHCEIS